MNNVYIYKSSDLPAPQPQLAMEPPAADAADDADAGAWQVSTPGSRAKENLAQMPEVASSAAQPAVAAAKAAAADDSASESEPVWTAAPEDDSSGWCRRTPVFAKLMMLPLREGEEEIEIPGTPPKAAPSKAPPPLPPKATAAVQNSKAAAPKPKPPPLSVGPAFEQEGAVVESQSQAHVRRGVGGLHTFTVTTTTIITTKIPSSDLDVQVVVKRRRTENESV